MAKKFAYISFGMLCLVAANQLGGGARGRVSLGPQSAAAGVVIEDVGIVSQFGELLLDSNGDVWGIFGGCWLPFSTSAGPLPVPVSDLKFWHPNTIVTKSNVLWREADDGGGGWINCGPWPGGPIATESESWGGVKGKYR